MKVLTAFAIFAAAATALPTEEHPVKTGLGYNHDSKWAQNFLTKLESISWDRSQPPQYTADNQWESCFDGFMPYTARFWEEMRILADRPVTTEAIYFSHVEASALNPGPGSSALKISTSTTSTNTKAKGWSIGAKLAGNFGKKDVGGGNVEISASYSDIETTTKSETKTVIYEKTCPPGFECRIETWSFHLKINATAERDILVEQWGTALGVHGICSGITTGCIQLNLMFYSNCQESSRGYTLINKTKDVQLTVPIKERDGPQVMSHVVFVMEALNMKKARDESEQYSMGTKEAIVEAMQQGTKFQLLSGPEE